MSHEPPWGTVFVDPDADPPAPARIALEQVDKKAFVLGSAIRFTGESGVAGLPEAALTLRPDDLGPGARTDLASVPAALAWFVGRYGEHTPAVLLHDRLIGRPGLAGVTEQDADRFFRYMLHALGTPFLRRWLMWAAVAFGTRWRAKGRLRALVVAWSVLSLAGMGLFVWALVTGQWLVAAIAALAPLPASAMWGKQWGAGIVAAYSAPWLAPPTVLGAIGYYVYRAIEKVLSFIVPDERTQDEPVEYPDF